MVGIDTRTVHNLVFGVRVALSVATRIILIPQLFITPVITGPIFTLKAFVVTVLGGLGNVWGAIGGGIYGAYLSFLDLHNLFFLPLSVQIALTAIIGGRGTVWGPAPGATLFVPRELRADRRVGALPGQEAVCPRAALGTATASCRPPG